MAQNETSVAVSLDDMALINEIAVHEHLDKKSIASRAIIYYHRIWVNSL